MVQLKKLWRKIMNKNKILNNYLILLTSGFLIEVIFRLINNLNILNFSFLRTFIGINVISIILSLIYSIFPRKVSYVFSSITVLIFSIYSFSSLSLRNLLLTLHCSQRTNELLKRENKRILIFHFLMLGTLFQQI